MTDQKALIHKKDRLRIARAWSRLAVTWESVAPAILPLALVITAFFTCSWLGLFRTVGDDLRIALGGIFALTTIWALLPLGGIRFIGGDKIDRRIEQDNALLHQPITSQDDKLAVNGDDFAQTLWKLHQQKMASEVDYVEGVRARTDIPTRDPWALRTLAPLALLSAFAFSYGTGGGALSDVFRSHHQEEIIPPRLDAWITPPSYTGTAPIFMTSDINAKRTDFTAPEGSKIVVRIAGGEGNERVFFPDLNTSLDPKDAEGVPQAASQEFEFVIRESGSLSIQSDQLEQSKSLGAWTINVTPDNAPTITFDNEDDRNGIERAVNGALTLRYIAEDDFRVVSGQALVALSDDQSDDARPLYDAPEIKLTLPRRNADGKAKTTTDLTEHPWAGASVRLSLRVEDDLEQIGQSEEVITVLPGRPFSNSLSRALIEQRRDLALDANKARQVYDMLDLFMLYPEETIDNPAHFLGLTTAKSKLRFARTDDQLREVVDYLWEVARNIEDGGLSDAERRLKDAQQALRDALERGASDEEIEQLMAELRDAMQDFMREFAEQNRNNPNMQPQNQQNAQQLDQRSLDEMLDRLEEMAKSGAREQAMDMLSQLQDMMNNLQMGQSEQQQGQEGQNQAQQQMNELGEILRQQQELMDETFQRSQRPEDGGQDGEQGQGQQGQNGEQRQPGQQGQQGQQSQGGQQGQDGNQPGQQGQQGGQGQQGQQGQGSQQPGQQGQGGIEGLAPGQQALQERLDQFMDGLRGMGINPGDEFNEAGEAMGQAGDALGDGSGQQALNEQGNAMDALRRGAQSMLDQMQQQAQQGQQGQNQPGGTQNRGDRDPLGRPQRTDGPDFGDSVDVPDEIDVRRAREILEAIRKRLGNGALEELEKDYLERLLDLN